MLSPSQIYAIRALAAREMEGLGGEGTPGSVPKTDLAVLLAAADARAEHFFAAALERQADDDNAAAVGIEVLAAPPPEVETTVRKLL